MKIESGNRYAPKGESAPLYPLTEKLSFILKYKDAVSISDILTITNTPGYHVLGPYFGLKIFDSQPHRQKDMLENILNDIEDYTEITKNITNFLQPNGKIDHDLTIDTVHPKEISRVALWGETIITNRAQKIVEDTKAKGEIPVIIGYGGLLALKPIIDNATSGDTSFLVFPERKASELKGFKLTKTNTKTTINDINESDLQTASQITLIDDAEHSGTTFDKVERIFPNTSVRKAALFRT